MLLQTGPDPDKDLILPENYSFWNHYEACSAGRSRNQGPCNSCWALATAAALSYRACRTILEPGPVSYQKRDFFAGMFQSSFSIADEQLFACTNVGSDIKNKCESYGCVPAALKTLRDKNDIYPARCMGIDLDQAPLYSQGCLSFPRKQKIQGCSSTWRISDPRTIQHEEGIKAVIFQSGPVISYMRLPAGFDAPNAYDGKEVYESTETDRNVWQLQEDCYAYGYSGDCDKTTNATACQTFRSAHEPSSWWEKFKGWFSSKKCPPFVTHAVVIGGWGVSSDNKPYWLIYNPWGKIFSGDFDHTDTGDSNVKTYNKDVISSGFFRLARATDDFEILARKSYFFKAESSVKYN